MSAMSPRRFDAVFFDLGHTLIYPHPSFASLYATVCAEEGFPLAQETAAAMLANVDQAIAATQLAGRFFSASLEESRHFWLSLYRDGLAWTGRPYPDHLPEALYARFTDHTTYRIYPDVLPTLAAIREQGLRIAAISNWEAWAEELLVSLDLARWFDVILISGTLGMEKPDPRIFHLALERADVDPAAAVHVGDNPDHDCAAAHAVGITPVLLDRHDRHDAVPWIRMSGLDGFAEWLVGG